MSALVLLSGGLDSTTVLAIALKENNRVNAITFEYGQRHQLEILRAKEIAASSKVHLKTIKVDLTQMGGSALTDINISVPKNDRVEEIAEEIPITYVPARNTIFLSLALSYAEIIGATKIYIGVNSVDYSGYPDCRPNYIKAFEKLANLATSFTDNEKKFEIKAPLIDMTKSDIIKRGLGLDVDYSRTITCYDPDEFGNQCGRCDACLIRMQGFSQIGIKDPAKYVAS